VVDDLDADDAGIFDRLQPVLDLFIDRSLTNLAVDSLDLVQLHCPTRDVLYQPEVFEGLDALQKAGKIKSYGVSVEKV
ncbi:aldo/keto reductase, partial [Rhizobium ruizarguesonis]